MPLYFFDLYDGGAIMRDEYGAELASDEEAADQAAALLPDLAREALPDGDARDFAALVRGEDERVVYRAALLFRGQRMKGHEFQPGARLPEVDDMILRSRETRAAARHIAARLREDVHALLTIIQSTSRTGAAMKAEWEARS